LRTEVPSFRGPLQVRQFRGGQSNPTYRLDTLDRPYVLRRQPPGNLLKGAHAVDREARVLCALGPTPVPTPEVFGFCNDPTIIGTPFFVMELLDGRIFWSAELSNIDRDSRGAYLLEMADVLAKLHDVDYAALGLENFGKPRNYLDRQLRRWASQYTADAEVAGREPALETLIDWLSANLPADHHASIVHGDFRIDNVVFHPVEPRIIGVLDWELSTIGDPLSDLAYAAMTYRIPAALSGTLGGLDHAAMGLPDEAAFIARYCRTRGIASPPNLDTYFAFNLFRFACILHGIKARIARGTAASTAAADKVAILPTIAELALAQARTAQR